MKPVKILCDSCSDLTKDIRDKYSIDSIDFSIYIDGKEIYADPWVNVAPEDLYDTLRRGERVYTLPATEQEIKKKFYMYANDYDILYIAACEKQSTTIQKARRIATEMMEKNSDYRIEIVDSLNASIGQALVTLKAAEFLAQGMTMEEIISEVSKLRNNVLEYATVDTLTYLSKANKINARSAALGNLFDIKPILISDADGNQVALKNVRGKNKSINTLVDLFLENVLNPEEQEIFIIHGDDFDTAQVVKEMLVSRGLVCKNINVFCVGPVVGITTGPGMVGIFGFGKEVTFRGE